MAKYVSKRLKIKKRLSKYTSNQRFKISNTKDILSKKDNKVNYLSLCIKKDNIGDYLSLCTNLESRLPEYRLSWKVTLEESLVFYKIDVSNTPTIMISIKIDKSLNVSVFTKDGKVKSSVIESLLNSQEKLGYWSQLRKLLEYFDNESFVSHVSIKYNLSQSLKYLKSCETINSAKGDTFGLGLKLKFLQNQIDALLHNKYVPNMVLLAYSIYLKSSSCYKFIQSLDLLVLPDEADLLKYFPENERDTDGENNNLKSTD